jgi:hypothetical protein
LQNALSPIFVGGTGRSGTTAVFHAIATGRGIVSAAPELRVHIDPKGALSLLDALSDNWSPYQADIAVHEFVSLLQACRRSNRMIAGLARRFAQFVPISPRRYAGLSLGSHFGYSTYDTKLQDLLSELTLGVSKGYWAGTRSLSARPLMYETQPLERGDAARIIGGFFHDLYRAIAKPNDQYWVESTPYSILHAEKLLELFPNAKFIHVVRSPLDILASYLRMHWGGTDAKSVANRLAHIHERWRIVRSRIPESSYLEVRLEDIADDSDNSWRQITSFLDRENDYGFNSNSIRPDALHRDRWRHDLTEQSRREAQSILQIIIDEYEYTLVSQA